MVNQSGGVARRIHRRGTARQLTVRLRGGAPPASSPAPKNTSAGAPYHRRGTAIPTVMLFLSMQRDNPTASRAAKDGASLSARALLRRLRTGLFRTLAPMLPRPLETRREPERGAPPVAPGLTSSAKASGHRRIAVIGAAGFEPGDLLLPKHRRGKRRAMRGT